MQYPRPLGKMIGELSKLPGIGNKSAIEGTITRPVVCIQCGKCAKVCPVGAIRKNLYGAYVVDIKMCINCGKCREACPFGVMVEDTDINATKKCLACGECAKACPMGVLSVYIPPRPLTEDERK